MKTICSVAQVVSRLGLVCDTIGLSAMILMIDGEVFNATWFMIVGIIIMLDTAKNFAMFRLSK